VGEGHRAPGNDDGVEDSGGRDLRHPSATGGRPGGRCPHGRGGPRHSGGDRRFLQGFPQKGADRQDHRGDGDRQLPPGSAALTSNL
jgi:hypothetical protein